MRKIIFSICCCLLSYPALKSQDTFSITAVDSITGEVGSAGASCIDASAIPGGCIVISYIRPGYGVIHTQALYTSTNKAYGAQLMQADSTPQQILDSLIANDAANNPSIRQYGIAALVNGRPQTAAYTGTNCMDYKNHIQGTHYTIQGNILLNQGILDSMEARFLHTPGDLACRLMAALEGAKVPGADTRCLPSGNSSLSAFLRVAKPGDTPGVLSLDLNVPIGPAGFEPIDSLHTLFLAAGGCRPLNTLHNRAIQSPNIFFHATDNSLHISDAKQDDQISVYDLQGSLIKAYSAPLQEKIEIPTLNTGVYIWRLQRTSGEIFNGKFIVE